jgi:hypothetical protein
MNKVTDSTILWRRLDQPGHESARLSLQTGSWHLQGTSVFLHDQFPCRLDYHIVCDSRWHTQSGKVAGWVGNRLIDISLGVGNDQRWLLDEKEAPEVAGCIDLDLNFSPSTNLLPVRRLDLAVGEKAEVRAAWLRFPSFKLELLVQVYQRTGETTYRYESGGGEFVAELQVNKDGFVKKYADLWEMQL